MHFWIPRCWDSHAHLMNTGVEKHGLKLSSLTCIDDLAKLKVEKHHFRGDWLVGFGWDQFQFSGGKMPTRLDLDRVFPDKPVYFTRKDGHASWVNTKAIQQIKLWPESLVGGEIQKEESGIPNGILIDRAMSIVEQKIPAVSEENQLFFIQEAISIFNQAGFSHLRDMGGRDSQWEILCELETKNKLSLYVEQNFCFDSMEDFSGVLAAATKRSLEQHSRLRMAGVKFFIDGALGSEGAWLSQAYPGTKKFGLSLWTPNEIEEILRRAWEKNLPVAVHSLGDAAVEQIVEVAFQLKSKGFQGQLNLEHVEVVRESTIKKVAAVGARVHMQPCHWLSDKSFLKNKLGQLYSSAFPWKKFQEAHVKIHWGSDSPIEKPSVFDNWKALQDSAENGIPLILGNLLDFHSHPDENWGGQCRTQFNFDLSKNPTEFIFE